MYGSHQATKARYYRSGIYLPWNDLDHDELDHDLSEVRN